MRTNLRCTRPECGRTYYSAAPEEQARESACDCGGRLEVVEPVERFMRAVGRTNGRRRPSSRASR